MTNFDYEELYQLAIEMMNDKDNTESVFIKISESFEMLGDYKDSEQLASKCREKAENCRKQTIYDTALKYENKPFAHFMNDAIKEYEKIIDFQDSAERIEVCKKRKIELEEKERQEQEEKKKLEEERRRTTERAKKRQKKIIGIVLAVIAVCIVFVIVLTTVIIPISKYSAAMELFNAGKYEEAASAFENVNYKDSAERVIESKYYAAVSKIEQGNIIEGYEALVALNGYKDSAEKASDIFEQYKTEKLKVADKGDYVFYGKYEQDNDTSNGKEDIEWLVLKKEDNKVLAISKQALDCQQYNTEYTDVTWKTCTLRKWLNTTFFSDAFSEDEKTIIQSTKVTADKNPDYSTSPGDDTSDKLFLLSITEVNKYFDSDKARQCKLTDYAKAQGTYTNSSNGNCWWWLRSPGGSDRAASVSSGGFVGTGGNDVTYAYGAVRPVLYIDVSNL